MKRLRGRLKLWFRYAQLGWELRPLGANRRSRLKLFYLGCTTLLRTHGILSRSVCIRLKMGGAVYPVHLKTRTELEVLREALGDEYAAADAIRAETIVDLGANIGIATLRLLSSHPTARVIAVEADPVLIPRLRQNVAGLPVTIVHAAICDTAGTQTFYRSDIFAWGNSLNGGFPQQEAVTVPSMTLPELLREHDLGERLDLLKMDIEGSEWEVFKGGVIPAQIYAVIGEVHERDQSDGLEHFMEEMAASMEVRLLSRRRTAATFLATR